MRRLLSFIFLLFSTISGYGQAPARAKSLVHVVGTKISLQPPIDFIAATQFSGFQNEALNASIVVTELPAPIAEIIKGFDSPAQLAQRQMILLEKQLVQNAENKGWLYKIQQKELGSEFLKWIYAFSVDEKAVLVVAVFPVDKADEVSEKLKTSILSASYDKEKNVDLTDGLNFKISESVNLKIAGRIPNTLLLTLNGKPQSQNVDEPVFAVGQSYRDDVIQNRRDFARNRLESIATVSGVTVKNVASVKIDNLDGYEMSGAGRDEKTGKAMFVYQTMLFGAKGYFILTGTISENNKEKYQSEFREITKSFKRIN